MTFNTETCTHKISRDVNITVSLTLPYDSIRNNIELHFPHKQ